MLILFDIDDTLIDHSSALTSGVAALYRRLDARMPLDQFSARWQEAHVRNYERFLAGEIGFEQQRRNRVREAVDATLDDRGADRVFSIYYDAYQSAWTLFPDVIACLDALNGHRFGIITNGPSIEQRRKLTATGIDHRFACVVISEECGHAKPAADFFRHALTLGNVQPDEVMCVGDRYDLDVVPPRALGMQAVWLDRARTAASGQPGPVISSLSELPSLIGG